MIIFPAAEIGVDEWRARPKIESQKRTLIRWERSAIGEFHGEDEAGRSWTIRELLDSDQLAEEGKALEHCVATYTSYCARRSSTIWSVAIQETGGRQRVATVEVNPASREVVQAKGRLNEEPGEPCQTILKRWASREGLKVVDEDAEEGATAFDPILAGIATELVFVIDVTIGGSTPSWQCTTDEIPQHELGIEVYVGFREHEPGGVSPAELMPEFLSFSHPAQSVRLSTSR